MVGHCGGILYIEVTATATTTMEGYVGATMDPE
jgi:hypothetical protein